MRLSRQGREATRDRLYAWWWWRSRNRPHLLDRTYVDLLEALPADALGLDLGSRRAVRAGAVTLDVTPGEGVDVVGDGHALPFADDLFDYVWCNAVLEHVRDPFRVAAEIRRVVRPGGLVFVQVPFLESVHGWPDDYFRFTPNGLRVLFEGMEEVAAGVSAGPGQVLPDLVQYYATDFAELQRGGLLVNLYTVFVGTLVLPIRYLDRRLRHRPSFWKWARAFYHVAREPETGLPPASPRLAFVAPPVEAGFEEIMAVRGREMIEELRRLGASVAAVTPADAADSSTPAAGLVARAAPEAVVAPNLNYYLLSALAPDGLVRTLGARPVCLWDDPLGALALAALQARGGAMGDLGPRESGWLERHRDALGGHDALHFAWDSGHVRAVVELGLAPADAIEHYDIATYRPFLEQGARRVEEDIDLSFCGNVYESAVAGSTFATDPWFAALVERLRARKLADLTRSSWDVYTAELADLPERERRERGLVPDGTPFWDLYLHVAWFALTTAVRLELLGGVTRPVEVFGLFADPESAALLEARPNLRHAGRVEHFGELPRTFARTKVNLCISNGLVFDGVPSKFVDCVASGGFALIDPKPDLRALFGPEIERVFVRGVDELNEKIEHFLARPDERRELIAGFQETIRARCTLEPLLTRLLARVG